ncbi:MAG: cystathionine gamma-synthase [Acidimicrobiales bacterium]|nr:cystathionine gamma-synthase [Acidimicrobiales bacterium]
MASENMDERWGFETRAIHAGQKPDPRTGAITVPVYQTTTYEQDAVGEDRGYEYSRTGNPTRDALELSIAALEGAEFGRAFASGMAAEDTILRLLNPGDHIVMGNDAYGGTFRLISKVLTRMGVTWSAADFSRKENIENCMTEQTRIIWTETPSNPLLSVVDIQMLSELAHSSGALCVVDNTFATPYLQQPLAHGADFVVHSTTKYLGGHSDVVGGFIATNSSELDQEIAFLQNAIGAVPAPWDCYLLLRGIKTLPVRMDRHCENAESIVNFLLDHPKVAGVLYPGLREHPTYEIAQKQMKKYGGMVSFTVKGGAEAARQIAAKTNVFTLAESLGAVESLIEVPAAMTHLSAEGSPLEVDGALIRLSVGIETVDDLIEDLAHALS